MSCFQIHDEMISELGEGSHLGLAIAVYLVQNGASLRHKNHQNKLALELASEPRAVEILRKAVR